MQSDPRTPQDRLAALEAKRDARLAAKEASLRERTRPNSFDLLYLEAWGLLIETLAQRAFSGYASDTLYEADELASEVMEKIRATPEVHHDPFDPDQWEAPGYYYGTAYATGAWKHAETIATRTVQAWIEEEQQLREVEGVSIFIDPEEARRLGMEVAPDEHLLERPGNTPGLSAEEQYWWQQYQKMEEEAQRAYDPEADIFYWVEPDGTVSMGEWDGPGVDGATLGLQRTRKDGKLMKHETWRPALEERLGQFGGERFHPAIDGFLTCGPYRGTPYGLELHDGMDEQPCRTLTPGVRSCHDLWLETNTKLCEWGPCTERFPKDSTQNAKRYCSDEHKRQADLERRRLRRATGSTYA